MSSSKKLTENAERENLKKLKEISNEEIRPKIEKKAGQVYAEEVDMLREERERMREEIKRLSEQVVHLAGERDAFKSHGKILGETLKKNRKSSRENHVPEKDLGIDFNRSFSFSEIVLNEEKVSSEKVSDKEKKKNPEKDPRIGALEIIAKENGWLLDPEELTLGKKIGSGATADIFSGTWRGLDVAIKCHRPSNFQTEESALPSLLQEVELLARQRHPFVLRLLGASLQVPDSCRVVTELLAHGSIAEWLHGEGGRQWKRQKPLPPLKERVRVAKEVAQGMQYLHEQKPMVIHRDLKPSNVFLDQNFHVRIADFGFARFVPLDETAMTGETGTYMYMAPEVVKHDHYDEKCDVYSFGVMLCEILSGNPPFIETYLTPMQMAVGVSDGSLRPKLPHGLNPKLTTLISSSWAQDSSKRPAFSQITQTLKGVLIEMESEHSHHQKDQKGGIFGFMHH